MNVLSILEMISGNLSEAAILMDGAISCYTAAGDLDYVASLRSANALSFMIKGEYRQALSHNKTLLPSVIEENSHYVLLETFLWLAWETWALKDYESTAFYCQNALALQGEIPDSWFTPEYFLGRVTLSRRDFSRSEAYLKEYLLSWDQPTAILFSHFRLGLAINALAVLAAVQGQVQRAAMLFGAQDGLFNWVKGLFSLREREEFEDALIAVRASLGEDSLTTAWNKGRALTIAQAIQLGVAAGELGSS